MPSHSLTIIILLSASLAAALPNPHIDLNLWISERFSFLKTHTFSGSIVKPNQQTAIGQNLKYGVGEDAASYQQIAGENAGNRLLEETGFGGAEGSTLEVKPASSHLQVSKGISSEMRVNANNNGLQTSDQPRNQPNTPNNPDQPNNPSPPSIRNPPTIPPNPRKPKIPLITLNSNLKKPSSKTTPPQIFDIGIQPYAISGQQRLNAISWRSIVEQDIQSPSEKMSAQYSYYEQKYNISSYEELPFCIVVPTYNNKPEGRYLRNIRSIVMQNYSNYHIVVIDDGSTDGTGQLITQYLLNQTSISEYHYEVVRNEEQMKAMHNLRKAALEYCQPHEIFLIVDGDDELVGRQVLKLFNSVFQKTGAWFVYSNFIMNQASIGYSRPFPRKVIEDNGYRNYPFVTSHLRAFYTQLFANIKEEDLRDENGQYYSAANDVAICIPTLEQSHHRVKYIPELTYFYNSNTGQNNHIVRAIEQRSNDRKIRRKPAYAPLDQLFQQQQNQ